LNVALHVPAGTNVERAAQILERAETMCLIARSLRAVMHLRVRVVPADAALDARGVDAFEGVPV
jgi:hypothetical protein